MREVYHIRISLVNYYTRKIVSVFYPLDEDEGDVILF